MKTTSLLRALVFSGAFAAATCVTPANAQSIASKLELLGTPASLEFTGLRMREQNGLLNIQAEVTNRDSRPQRAFYRVKWIDESGFQVWEDEPWKPVLLHGDQKLTLQMSAPTTKARDFTIQFSAADNKSLGGANGGNYAAP